MAKQAKRLRAITLSARVSTPALATALKVSRRTARDWREGYQTIPPATFEVIDAAFVRYSDFDIGDDNIEFVDIVARLAKLARLPGFR